MSKNLFRRWLRRHSLFTGRFHRVTYYSERHELPEVPKANEIAVAGTPTHPKWLLIDCPCGYGHTILLPLSKKMKPHWSLQVDGSSSPSVYPSIDRNRFEGVRCHFWIRDGSVQWT